MDLFLGLGVLALVLALLVSPALGALLEQGQPLLALLAGLAAGLVPVLNLYRYRQAPGGCLALALGFAAYLGAYALRQPPLTCALALAAPNLGFLVSEPVLRRLREQRALARIDAAPDATALVAWLGDPAVVVRERAAERLAAGPLEPTLAALVPALSGLPLARAAAWSAIDRVAPSPALEAWLTRQLQGPDDEASAAAQRLGRKHPAAAAARADDPRPAVRLGLGAGLLAADPAHAPSACGLLVGVLADPEVPAALRQEALDALEPAQASAALAEAARAADPAQPTAELLWLWAEHGQAAQAARAVALVATDDYARANAALEAVAGIVGRLGDLGEHAATVAGGLRSGVEALRAVHPPGDNPLADGLVEDLEVLRAALGEPRPPSASADAAT